MDVTVGITNRAEMPPRRVHLAVQVGGRNVLACSGGAVADPRPVPFDTVLAELDCSAGRKFWNRAMKVDRSAG